MRELEFLPTWYVLTANRRRMVLIQAWLTVAMGLALGLWVSLVLRNIGRNQEVYTQLHGDLIQSQVEVRQTSNLISERNQLLQEQRVLSKLGLHVEAARVIRTLDTLMPPQMSLLSVQMDTEEMTPASAGLATQLGAAADLPTTRRLHVKIQGVAPSDVDVGNFEAQLRSVPFLDQVAFTYVKERNEAGHVMREFEAEFVIGLDVPDGT
jgi:Tfp pilus assembly protein PilN